MALYTRESVERVKDAVDMVALAGARTDLRRVGSRYTGLCPFHDERTPSFSVNAEHKLYHCFGCGASGDAIRFAQETEGLDFREAIEFLAERTGVELVLEREDPRAEERRRRRERLLRLVERAAGYYARYLWDSQEAGRARAYLEGRGLGEEVLREFRVGYAPSAWDRVLTAAQRDGFAVEELVASGLAQQGRQGGWYDRFRGRIMFPLADARGRVLGFGARAVREEQRPKYLNTSENDVYRKGDHLFGLHLARGAASRARRMLVVEGYTDVLALHQVGIRDSVAIMGTALTEAQLRELAIAVGSAGTVYLALDADRAGQEAMLRAARGAQQRDVQLRVVEMPEGTDPADLVAAEGAEGLTRLLDGAVGVPRFHADRTLAAADLGSPEGRDRALEQLRPIVNSVPGNTATRDELVRYVADKLDVPEGYLTTQLTAPRTGTAEIQPERGPIARAAAAPSPIETRARAERAFLAMCLAQARLGREEIGRDYLAAVKDEHLSSDALRRVRDHLLANYQDPLTRLPEDPTLAAQVMGVSALADEEPSSEAVLRLSFLQLELRRVERELRQVEEHQDFERQGVLSVEKQDIRRQMDEVMGQAS
jgi:DNA primase